MKILSGVYQIVNIVNGHMYIGSSKNILKRWKRHIWALSNKRHHSIYLQRAYNLYPKESFEFSVIKEVDKSKLFEYEEYYINKLRPEYNLGSVGGGDTISNHPNLENIKKKHKERAKARYAAMSQEDKEKFLSYYSKKGDKNPNWKGGITNQKQCLKCGCNISCYAQTCRQCQDMYGDKNPFYGKTHSDETKEKIRQSKIGKKPSNSKQITINGITYKSQSDAARALGVVPAMITYRIKKGIYTVTAPKSNLS